MYVGGAYSHVTKEFWLTIQSMLVCHELRNTDHAACYKPCPLLTFLLNIRVSRMSRTKSVRTHVRARRLRLTYAKRVCHLRLSVYLTPIPPNCYIDIECDVV